MTRKIYKTLQVITNKTEIWTCCSGYWLILLVDKENISLTDIKNWEELTLYKNIEDIPENGERIFLLTSEGCKYKIMENAYFTHPHYPFLFEYIKSK